VETSLNGLPVQNNAEFGWTAGGGLEWAFADNWTAKVEYLPAANANINAKFNENIVRVGVNFKFGH
jgi:outer membrane immunogenic protein